MLLEPQYVDDEPELIDFPLREGLTYMERRQAEQLEKINKGVMFCHGDTGAGKDLFGISICAMSKYFHSDIVDTDQPRKILLDFKPKRAFGEYIPFSPEIMKYEIEKMAAKADMKGFEKSVDPKEAEFIADATEDWAYGEGESLLKGSIMYLMELKRYCDKRKPMNPLNIMVGSLCTVSRHLRMLILGTHTYPNEIDVYRFNQYVTHWVRCVRAETLRDTTFAYIEAKGVTLGNEKFSTSVIKMKPLKVNGRIPRDYLGGLCLYDLYDSWNMVNLRPTLSKKNKYKEIVNSERGN